MNKLDRRWANALVFYLLLLGVGAAVAIVVYFPTTLESGQPTFRDPLSSDQGLILLAILAGMAGSFLHAAQSLISYMGNATFRASWTAWYGLRPWVGAVLGFAIYFAFRAGLVPGGSNVNPYGVVAIGLLGGWFSKTTTDKLQEVFETLFKTDEDRKRIDKLHGEKKPLIESISPSPVPADADTIIVVGRRFRSGASMIVGDREIDATLISETVLTSKIVDRPTAGSATSVQVKNPGDVEAVSNKIELTFD
ncbi:MAG: IPT/TIG domain-containing protein [Planctomycetota bacterium]